MPEGTATRPTQRLRTAAAPREIATGVAYLSVLGSNVYFVRSGSSWVLIDAAWASSAATIRHAAQAWFGSGTAPAAILLTHCHPDHAGSADQLARLWGCLVYVHPDEWPLALPTDLATIEKYANPLDRRPARTSERAKSNSRRSRSRPTRWIGGLSCRCCAPCLNVGLRRCCRSRASRNGFGPSSPALVCPVFQTGPTSPRRVTRPDTSPSSGRAIAS